MHNVLFHFVWMNISKQQVSSFYPSLQGKTIKTRYRNVRKTDTREKDQEGNVARLLSSTACRLTQAAASETRRPIEYSQHLFPKSKPIER